LNSRFWLRQVQKCGRVKPPQTIVHKKDRNMTFEFQVLAWTGTKCGRVKPVKGFSTPPPLIIGSPMTTDINKQ
jgi:hypothetical protein